MGVVAVLGIAVLSLLGGLILIFARREVLSRRGGTIDMNLRVSAYVTGRGWAPGLGRFSAEELRWYRLFSLVPRPRRVFARHRLVIEERRRPEGVERLAVPEGWVIVRCRSEEGRGTSVELAMAEAALSGFLSWLESAPPSALRSY
jgi:hypothetical protein